MGLRIITADERLAEAISEDDRRDLRPERGRQDDAC